MFRWVLILVILVLTLWFVYSSSLGLLYLNGPFFRLLLFGVSTVMIGILLQFDQNKLITYQSYLIAALIFGSVIGIANQAISITNYPFKLYWSEGNRIWDYSTIYGAHLYELPSGKILTNSIERGRGVLWGLPYLFFPMPSIELIRLWDAILVTVPYALLGLVAGWAFRQKKLIWLSFILWAFLFLNQGPIYTPLVLGAILVVGGMQLAILPALSLLLLSVLYVAATRFTWIFAPIIWLILIFIAGPSPEKRAYFSEPKKILALVSAGILGSIFSVKAVRAKFLGFGLFEIATSSVIQDFRWLIEYSIYRSSYQPLIWSRLLPNDSYPPGILLSTIVAVGPPLLLVWFLAKQKKWRLNLLQAGLITISLCAFLAVGLTSSIKIGGGLDLHNMDMLLITVLVLSALMIQRMNNENALEQLFSYKTSQYLLLTAVIIPSFFPLWMARPNYQLPSKATYQAVLHDIQDFVACAEPHGQILFMDERQLLTFGHIDTILIRDYEKIHMMDHAMEGNHQYFKHFYADLENDRFSLIVLDPQKVLIKDEEESLSAENNAWTNWVTKPLLMEYESVYLNNEVKIELFMPIGRDYQCP
jgi:hypothetical protein